MMEVHVGERVTFQVAQMTLEGIVARIDRRNATLISADGRAWIIGTSLLLPPTLTPKKQNTTAPTTALSAEPR